MGLERNQALMLELLEKQQPRQAKRTPSHLATKERQWPKRYAVPLVIASGVLVSVVVIQRGTPQLSETQVASLAAGAATDSALAEQERRWAEMRAEATTVVQPEPLSVYGLELTEDAKTAIGWVGQPGNLRLNAARAEVVAKQVRVLSASVRLLDLRLTSKGPTDLRVHTNVAEGFAWFLPPSAQAPAPASTVTSAP